MSKTYLYCLIVIGAYLFIVKAVNKKDEIGVQDSHIANDFESGNIEKASYNGGSSNPVHTL